MFPELQVIDFQGAPVNICKLHNSLLMKTKLGNTVLCNTDPLPACLVHDISLSLQFHVLYSKMLAATFMNMEHHFGLRLQVNGDEFHHL
jgi:hypothetical protein